MKLGRKGRSVLVMATAPQLDPLLVRELDDLVAVGRFSSREDVVREGLRLVREQDLHGEPVDLAGLDPEERAWLEQRIAEADADPHEGYSIEEVFDELERLCEEDIERARKAAE